MKKLVFFDIDGTLAHPGQVPSAATVSAIRQLRANGHKAFLSTGRTIDSIPPAVAEIGFDGGIFSSGAVIAYNGEIIGNHFMPNALVQNILSVIQREAAFFTLETPEGRFNSDNGTVLLAQIDDIRVSPEMMKLARNVLLDPTAISVSKYSGQPIYKIAYYSTNWSFPSLLSSKLRNAVKVVPFDNIPGFPLAMGEISDPTITKGRALLELCEYLNIPAASTIAFGDSMNDSEIICTAALGVAMGNADPALKDMADLVCDRCEKDGIAKTLRELQLI